MLHRFFPLLMRFQLAYFFGDPLPRPFCPFSVGLALPRRFLTANRNWSTAASVNLAVEKGFTFPSPTSVPARRASYAAASNGLFKQWQSLSIALMAASRIISIIQPRKPSLA